MNVKTFLFAGIAALALVEAVARPAESKPHQPPKATT